MFVSCSTTFLHYDVGRHGGSNGDKILSLMCRYNENREFGCIFQDTSRQMHVCGKNKFDVMPVPSVTIQGRRMTL